MPKDIVTSFNKEHWFGKLYAPFLMLALIGHKLAWVEWTSSSTTHYSSGLHSQNGPASALVLIGSLFFYLLSLASLPILARNFKLLSLILLEISILLVCWQWVITMLERREYAKTQGDIYSFSWGFILSSNSLLFANISGLMRFPKLPAGYKHDQDMPKITGKILGDGY